MKTKILVGLLLVAAACVTVQEENVHPEWIVQKSGVTASLRGVCAVSSDVAWASGSEGTCLRTLDGGETWQVLEVPGGSDLDFRDVHAWDEDRAILLSAGKPARIFSTDDGGSKWTVRYTNSAPGVFFDAMAFWDEKRGIAFSDPVEGSFLLITTSDGGKTWKRIPPEQLPPPSSGEAGFAASGTCIAVEGKHNVWFATGGSAARVVRSADGGRTWTAMDAPVQKGSPSKGIFSIAFMDEGNGVVVGGDYQEPESAEGIAAWTEDGGKSWYPAEIQPFGYRSCAAYCQQGEGYLLIAVGPNGSDFSTDKGRTWETFSTEGFHSVSFAGSCGWAAGGEGRIARFQSSPTD